MYYYLFLKSDPYKNVKPLYYCITHTLLDVDLVSRYAMLTDNEFVVYINDGNDKRIIPNYAILNYEDSLQRDGLYLILDTYNKERRLVKTKNEALYAIERLLELNNCDKEDLDISDNELLYKKGGVYFRAFKLDTGEATRVSIKDIEKLDFFAYLYDKASKEVLYHSHDIELIEKYKQGVLGKGNISIVYVIRRTAQSKVLSLDDIFPSPAYSSNVVLKLSSLGKTFRELQFTNELTKEIFAKELLLRGN